MTNRDYDSAMLREIRNTVAHVNSFNATQTFDYLASCMPPEEIVKYRNVILTGCGDSYCAGIAAKPVFENVESFEGTGMAPGTPTEAMRNIEFTRYYNTYRGWNFKGPEAYRTLVCAVSFSGGPMRPREAMARINAVGGGSVAFTGNPSSNFAKEAKWIVNYNMQPGEPDVPQVRSYQASCFSLMMFGLYMSYCKGQMTRAQADEQRLAAMQYVNSFNGKVMSEIEEKAYELAVKWEEMGVDLMDFVAEGADYATSFFGSAKMVEAFGGLTTHDDAEDWLHINYFNRTPEKVGTFIIANESSPSFNRDLETIKVMVNVGRPLAIITDASDLSVFPEEATVFQLPKSKYKWANPLMQHIPMDYVAAFLGLMKGEYPYRRNQVPHDRDPGAARFIQSKLVVIGEEE